MNSFYFPSGKVWRVNVPEQVSLTAIGVTSTETVNVQVVGTGGSAIPATVVQVLVNANDGSFQRSIVCYHFLIWFIYKACRGCYSHVPLGWSSGKLQYNSAPDILACQLIKN